MFSIVTCVILRGLKTSSEIKYCKALWFSRTEIIWTPPSSEFDDSWRLSHDSMMSSKLIPKYGLQFILNRRSIVQVHKRFILHLFMNCYWLAWKNIPKLTKIEIQVQLNNHSWHSDFTFFMKNKTVIIENSKISSKINSTYLRHGQVTWIYSKSYINGGASFRWSFCPLFAWGSIESTTILTTHPSLSLISYKCISGYLL